MAIILSLITDDREYIKIIYEFSGPSQLPFTCKDMFIASLPLMQYSEKISPDMARLIAECGSMAQKQKLFCCMNARIIKRLLKDHTVSPAYRDCRGLRLAVKMDRIDIVKIFLADDRVDPNVGDGALLVIAARNGNRKMVNIILDAGAFSNSKICLDAAIDGGDSKIVKAFIQMCTKSIVSFRKAIASRKIDIIKEFIASKKYKSISKPGGLLHAAIMTDDLDILRLISSALIRIPGWTFTRHEWRVTFEKASIDTLLAFNKLLEEADMTWPTDAKRLIIQRIQDEPMWPIAFNMDLSCVDTIGQIATRMNAGHVYDFLKKYEREWLLSDNVQRTLESLLNAITRISGNIVAFSSIVGIIAEREDIYVKLTRGTIAHYAPKLVCMRGSHECRIEAFAGVVDIIEGCYVDILMEAIMHHGDVEMLSCVLGSGKWFPTKLTVATARHLWSTQKNVYTFQVVSYLFTHSIFEGWVIEAYTLYK
jgi:hypothetical protein